MDDPTSGPGGQRDLGSDPRLDAAVNSKGPLALDIAKALFERGRARLESGDAALASLDFRRVVGADDHNLNAAALLGLGEALYRLDLEPQAADAWKSVTEMRENPATYRAWRNLAGVRVRSGDLTGAIDAYREADGRAPQEDKAEIAARLGWLAKETGNQGAANKYFARSRGGAGLGLAQVLVLATAAVSLAALIEPSGAVFLSLALDPDAVRAGEWWRLLTVALVHAPGSSTSWFSLHLLLNMYALWIVGPIVEQAWGRRLLIGFYVLCALGGSTGSLLFSNTLAVGASGAIFGLVGVVLAGTRTHHPVLDQRARQIVPQLGIFTIINLAFGFFAPGMIDNAAHIGGLLAGLWLGFLVAPAKVPTVRSTSQQPSGEGTGRSPLLLAAGLIGLLGVLAAGLAAAGVGL